MTLNADIGIIIKIPKETTSMRIVGTVCGEDGHSNIEYYSDFSKSDIDEMRQQFLFHVELGDDYDYVYSLTDIGREFLDSLDSGN